MKIRIFGFAGVIGVIAAAAMPVSAALLFDQNVTNAVIFGSGNANGAFTVDRSSGIELGLRAKLRFDGTGQPQNVFNSNGDGTYGFAAGQAVGGFGFSQPPTTTPIWNFEWSINADVSGSLGRFLSDLTYLIQIDFDPSPGTNFLSFDPINVPFADHAIGDNSTGPGGGAVAGDAGAYTTLIDDNNLAQNSWNMEFFNNAPFDIFDPNANGEYSFILSAFGDEPGAVASTMMTVIVSGAVSVPEPASGLLFGMGLAGLALLRRGRRRAATPGETPSRADGNILPHM